MSFLLKSTRKQSSFKVIDEDEFSYIAYWKKVDHLSSYIFIPWKIWLPKS